MEIEGEVTWSSLAGHGVLLDVRGYLVLVVRSLMDPPVRSLPKQNPYDDNKDMLRG